MRIRKKLHRRYLAGVAVALAAPLLAVSPSGAVATNLALNLTGAGNPSPAESDQGWGGGSSATDLNDGHTTYDNWARGLAFTGGNSNWAGQPCGVRQATISFGSAQSVGRVVLWHHGDSHVPASAQVSYWAGAAWQPVSSTRTFGAVRTGGAGSVSDEYKFAAVSASKVRWSFNNCEPQMFPGGDYHGWLYEFEAFGPSGPGGSDGTRVVVTAGALAVDTPVVDDFTPIVLDGAPKSTTAAMHAFGVSDGTGSGAGWTLAAQASQFAEVDGAGAYVAGGKTLPGDSLSLASLSVTPDGTSSPVPTPPTSGPYVLDGGGAVTLLSAAAGTGMGRFVVDPGVLTLAVPGDVFARTYRSDVTLSLVSGP